MAKVIRQNSFWILALALAVVLFTLASCAQFGLTQPKTSGQTIVQGYGNALAVTAVVPGLLSSATINVDQAEDAQAASKAVRGTVDAYWAAAGLSTCQTTQTPICEGPNAVAVLAAISVSLNKLETFLLAHKVK